MNPNEMKIEFNRMIKSCLGFKLDYAIVFRETTLEILNCFGTGVGG